MLLLNLLLLLSVMLSILFDLRVYHYRCSKNLAKQAAAEKLKDSGDLKFGLVWILNGPKEVGLKWSVF